MIGIYKIVNIVNNKIYIGQSIEIKRRWNDHKSELKRNIHHNIYLQKSWNKYGEENFIFEVIESDENFNTDDLNELEIYYIDKLKTFDSSFGYNLTQGGFYNESKIKSVIQFDNLGNIIKEYKSTAEAEKETGINKETIRSNANPNKTGKSAGGFIWIYKEDYDKYGFNIDFYKDYNIKKCFKRIYQISLDGEILNIFSTIKDAVEKSEVNKKSIEACCDKNKPENKTAYGFIFCYEDEFNELGLENILKNRKKYTSNSKIVLQYNKNGEFINEYISVGEASRVNGINASHISGCCRGIRGSAKGYIWKYK